jgi:hypothetical protein
VSLVEVSSQLETGYHGKYIENMMPLPL